MAHILILGGGFGGVAAARRLRASLPAGHKITIIDRNDTFMVGFRKTWALLGAAPLSAGQRRLDALREFGIEFRQASIEAIDPESRSVRLESGEQLSGDAVLVALGAELATDAVPGFKEHAVNAYDPSQVDRNAVALQAFTGGQIAVGVFGLPYKCPPAPYELAILMQEKFAVRSVPATTTVFTPLPSSLPILGEEGCAALDAYMYRKGIRFQAGRQAVRVEPGAVHFSSGDPVMFDLLLGIPGHRAPRVVRDSPLAGEGGWIAVNPRTLETGFPGVYAVGDVTAIKMANGAPLPKAGVFAEGEALVAADRIAAVLAGREPTAVYQGRGGCFLEVGDGKAVMVEGHFLAPGAPQVALTEATEAYVDRKWAFERERLQGWFDPI